MSHVRNRSTRQSNWRTRGACRGHDPELWFATGKDNAKRQRAQTICRAACPVRVQCATWAFRNGIEYGIFGGFTAKERNAMLRRAGVRRKVQMTQKRLPARSG